MSLIATSVERSGVARIFFDLHPTGSSFDDQRRIAAAIEEAFALAATDIEVESVSLGLLIARQYDAAGRWIQRNL
jgi:hypothetical protein